MLMLSSTGSLDDAQRCTELGISSYVKKPIIQKELLFAIESTLLGKPSGSVHYANLDQSVKCNINRRLKILLVEDNLINQKLALALLRKWGHMADVAENGVIAIERFMREKYDVILMDMHMPEMGGIEATLRIRQIENGNSHIPIIAMTANAMQGDRERCLVVGMDHYLSKPIRSEVLRELLESYLAPDIQRPAQLDVELTSNSRLRMTDRRVTDDLESNFDYDTALAKADLDVLLIISPLFLEGCGSQMQEISDAIKQKNSELLHRSAHTMKGLVGNFQATPIMSLAKALELKAKNGDFDRVDYIFEDMNKQVKLMNAALNRFIVANMP